jgi:pyruvate dehydrogenase E2 component (dihydrolipoamide acetyltransferase)
LAAASIMLTADVELAQALALCADVPAIQLADIVTKAWAIALQRMAFEQKGIALALGKSRCVIVDSASKSLTSIAAEREAGAGDAAASTAISMPGVAGITSVADVLQAPHMAVLSIGAARRAPIEAADGSVKFVSMLTATLSCDHCAIDAARGAELLAAFKGFVERPVTMIV